MHVKRSRMTRRSEAGDEDEKNKKKNFPLDLSVTCINQSNTNTLINIQSASTLYISIYVYAVYIDRHTIYTMIELLMYF